MFPFYLPWKYQNTFGFQTFSRNKLETTTLNKFNWNSELNLNKSICFMAPVILGISQFEEVLKKSSLAISQKNVSKIF